MFSNNSNRHTFNCGLNIFRDSLTRWESSVNTNGKQKIKIMSQTVRTRRGKIKVVVTEGGRGPWERFSSLDFMQQVGGRRLITII